MADEIIKARVWQKVDTEENWLLNPLILGEGEQGFVWDGTQDPVNFKIGTGDKTFAELPYFIAYYSNVISHKLLRYENISVAQSILSIFKNNTNLYDVVITNIGGAPVVMKIGTTDGGSEIGEYNIGAGNTVLDIKYSFDAPTNLYLSGFDGNALSIIVVYFDYDESPAIPPGGAEPIPFRWPKGFVGMFVPVGTGHLEQCFDMITGLGIAGSKYENCQICNVDNTILDMENSYPIGYKTGHTIAGLMGNANNNYKLTDANIPEHKFFTVVGEGLTTGGFPGGVGRDISTTKSMINSYNKTGGSGKESYILAGQTGNTPTQQPNLSPTNLYGRPDGTIVSIDSRPRSKSVIYFLAITD